MMINMELIKKLSIVTMLGLLAVSAFFIRLENFKNSSAAGKITIDEMVYYRMGKQVLADFTNYNTIPYCKELAAMGRPLPDYFFAPLFKHPPVFAYLLALSMKIFGESLISASYVSIFLGVFMIPLIYILGTLVSGRLVGFLAAIFLWLDPVSIICSQKIWMDTPIAFFTLLSAVFFVIGATKNKGGGMYLLSGISSGLATNTKYTGILITFIIFLYALMYKRELLKNIQFQLGLILPFVMTGPWLLWNYHVYGLASLEKHSELLTLFIRLKPVILYGIPTLLIILVAFIFYKKKISPKKILKDAKRAETTSHQETVDSPDKLRVASIILIIVFFIIFLKNYLFNGLNFMFIPRTSWYQGFASGETSLFYFGRLLEFSLLYAFSLASIFLFHQKEKTLKPFIRWSAVVILLFFISWKNYQSRYILSSLPFLIILGVDLWKELLDRVSRSKNNLIYFFGKLSLKVILVYIIIRTYSLNLQLSYTNDMCYF